jgi:hypothetical protein
MAASFTLLVALVLLGNPLFAQNFVKMFKADVELIANKEAFDFDGSSPGIDLGRSSVLNFSGHDFTIHVWVRLAGNCNSSGPGCDMSIIDKMVNDGFVNTYGWRLLRQSDGNFWFCLGGGPNKNGCDLIGDTTVTSLTYPEIELWYSVAGVKTDSQISIYVNGVLEGTISLGEFFDSSDTPLLIGENFSEGAYLNGQIGEVQLFRSALSAPHVRALFERSKVRYGRR